MIETLVEAERALTHGRVDQAERLYLQVAASDPRSSIAVMGLARVALERNDDQAAYLHARAALTIDPENPAAQHLVMRLTEVMAGRGETPPDVDPAAEQGALPGTAAAPSPPPRPVATPPLTGPASQPPASIRRRPGLVSRLLGRGRKAR